ncbi:unnamed protein product, partial [Brassica napus]
MRVRSYTPSPSPSPPPRGHGRRGRSPSPTPRGGPYRDLSATLFVRNLSHDCRQKDLRRSFGQFGPLKDINLPRDYYSGYPRGFGFVEFEDRDDAAEAKYQMDGNLLLGRELSVVFAEDKRKKPTEMRAGQRGDGRSIRSRYYSRSPRSSRSPPPPRRSGDHYSPPSTRHHHSRKEGYDRRRRRRRRRSYSRSPTSNGSRGRSATSKSCSLSRSPPRRSISRSPSRNRSPSTGRRRRSNTPLPASRNRSPRPRRRRRNTPLPARRNRSPSHRRRRSNTPVPARS